MRRCVITGTGTDVGKTWVTGGLLRVLLAEGRDAVVQKPFQTGCRRQADGTLDTPDLETVAAIAGWSIPAEELGDLCPFRFEPACSPHLAARWAGVSPSVESAAAAARRLAEGHEVVLAETAGGLLVPVNDRETMLDWMMALGWPVLVVARAGLGTINETLLTVRTLRSAGLACAGVVLNSGTSSGGSDLEALIRRDNADAIRRHGNVDVLATLPCLGEDPRHADWTAFATAFTPPVPTLFGAGD